MNRIVIFSGHAHPDLARGLCRRRLPSVAQLPRRSATILSACSSKPTAARPMCLSAGVTCIASSDRAAPDAGCCARRVSRTNYSRNPTLRVRAIRQEGRAAHFDRCCIRSVDVTERLDGKNGVLRPRELSTNPKNTYGRQGRCTRERLAGMSASFADGLYRNCEVLSIE
jgi:hypothetical protein